MNEPNASVVERLLETVAWLSLHSLTDELVATPSDSTLEDIEVTLEKLHEHRVADLSVTNRELLGALTGKLLLLLVDMNLADGTASTVSDGFYDEFNLPPVATWVDLVTVGEAKDIGLICWIPEEYVARAQEGIDVNPEECIGWAAELAPDLHRDLAKGARGRVHLIDAP